MLLLEKGLKKKKACIIDNIFQRNLRSSSSNILKKLFKLYNPFDFYSFVYFPFSLSRKTVLKDAVRIRFLETVCHLLPNVVPISQREHYRADLHISMAGKQNILPPAGSAYFYKHLKVAFIGGV